MTEGDTEDFSEVPEESQGYEYVDEQGNPIDPADLDQYEPVDAKPEEAQEQVESPVVAEAQEIFSQEIPEEQPKTIESFRPENTASEYEEMLRDVSEIAGIPLEELKAKLRARKSAAQTFLPKAPTPIIIPQPKIEEKTPAEFDKMHLLEQAKVAQVEQTTPKPIEQIKQKKDPFSDELNIDLLRRLSMPGQSQQQMIYDAPIPKPEPPKTKPVSSARKGEPFDDSANTELLRRLTMPARDHQGVMPARDDSGDSKEKPLIYRKGHPHLGSTYGMDTISNLTNRIFNSDEAVKKLGVEKKRKF